MKTDVTELPESRVKIDVAIEPSELSSRIDAAARAMAGEMKLPGFRKGKVPPQLVIQRVGRDAVVEQALRDSMPQWYEQALLESGVITVGEPKLDVDALPAEGEELRFGVEVGVRPVAELGEYRGLEVGRAEPEVPESGIDEEIARIREGLGSLNPVDRAAVEGDVLVIDYAGRIDGETFDGSEGKDFAIELGAEGLLPEFDAALAGASAGDEVEVDVSFPEDHQPAELAGKTAKFAVSVSEVREKELPPLDDDFAQLASEFDTLDELREEVRSRMGEALERQAEQAFREAAVDAAAESAAIEIPHDLVHARAHEIWERFENQLSSRGIDPAAYAQAQGRSREEIVTEGEESAVATLRREAVLAAVAEAEGIEVSDDELADALGPGDGDGAPEKIVARLRESGRDALLRDEVRMRKAADLIAEQAKPIPLETAAAREAIWTPEKDDVPEAEAKPADGESGKLWTPGDGPAQ